MTLRDKEELTTEGGYFGRVISFMHDLKATDGNFSAVFKIGINADTRDPAIGIVINDGESHPFTIAEARNIARICEETLTEGDYDEIEKTVKEFVAEIRSIADLAEQRHSEILSKLVTTH